MSSDRVIAAVATFVEAAAELAELDCDAFTHTELLELLGELECVTWRLPTVGHRVIARLQREASPVELGAKSFKDVLSQRLRISGKEAARRLSEASDLGARTATNGEPLTPLLALTAGAQAAGSVGPEHVAVIRSFLDALPGWVDPEVRDLSEGTLVRIGAGSGPGPGRRNCAERQRSWPLRSIRTVRRPMTPTVRESASCASGRSSPTGCVN